jgi:putative salt-induced outer membrane protein
MCLRSLVFVVSLSLASPLLAAEEEADDPLEGNVKFGYLATTGNTETSSLNTSFEAKYVAGDWHHEAMASAINASENKVTTAEAYETGWKSGWNFSERDYVFGRLNWRKDRFGGFDTQFSQTVGYGRQIIDTDAHSLDGELGFGARQSEDQLGVSTNETIGTAALRHKWKFSETSEFGQTLRFEVGSDNTFSESVTSITARLIGALNLVASYTIRNNSDVPVGTEKTDTRTAISLEYTF